MKWLFKHIIAHPKVLLALYVPIYILIFFVINSFEAPSDEYWVSYSTIDDLIPFLPVFIIPYMLWFAYLILPALHAFVYDTDAFARYMCSIIAAFTIGALTFVLLPSEQNLRPEVLPDNIFGDLIALIYNADPPRNVLPSGHVSGAIAAWFLVRDCKNLWKHVSIRICSTILTVLILLSVVLIKQHSINDAFVSIVIMIPIIWFIYYRRKAVKQVNM